MSKDKRVLILANRSKEPVTEALRDFRPWLGERATVVGEIDTRDLTHDNAADLPEADLGVVLGGDGTMLSQARNLIDGDLPLLGINFGKLGFLAEFSLESFKAHWELIASDRCRTSQRLMLQVDVFGEDCPPWCAGDDEVSGETSGGLPEAIFSGVAMNDAVVNAGPPFRLIEIELAIQPPPVERGATTLLSDGVIVSTPSGSTAYNLAAGGPIISPGIDGLCITAICPHSLAARPIVTSANCNVVIAVRRANPGTQLVIDGQETCALTAGEQIRVQRHPRTVTLVHNPDYNYWKMLAHKMRWAVSPVK